MLRSEMKEPPFEMNTINIEPVKVDPSVQSQGDRTVQAHTDMPCLVERGKAPISFK